MGRRGSADPTIIIGRARAAALPHINLSRRQSLQIVGESGEADCVEMCPPAHSWLDKAKPPFTIIAEMGGASREI